MTRERAILAWARQCFAVDLCSGKVPVVVRAERTRSGLRVTPATLEEAADAGRRGQAVVGNVGVRGAFARWLAAPYPHVRKAQRVLPTLLDVELPFPLEDCLYSFARTHIAGQGSVSLAVGGRATDITDRLDAYTQHHLDPVALYHQGLALWSQAARDMTRPPGQGEHPRAIIFLSDTDPVLVVGESEDPAGLHALRPGDEANHVRQLMRARFTLGTPMEWVLAGTGTGDEERLAHIRTEVTTDWPGTPTVLREPATFLARALAWEAMIGSPWACNMRRGDLRHPMEDRRHRVNTRVAAGAALTAGLVLCTVNVAWRHAVAARDRLLENRIRHEASAIAGFPVVAKGADAVNQVSGAVATRKQQWEPFRRAAHPVVSRLLADIVRAAQANDIELTLATGTAESVTIAGTAATWAGPEALSAIPAARGIRIDLQRDEVRDDGRIPFTINAGGTP